MSGLVFGLVWRLFSSVEQYDCEEDDVSHDEEPEEEEW
jgi:hypothetical protein